MKVAEIREYANKVYKYNQIGTGRKAAKAMTDFYKSGQTLPSIARIVMQDEITKCIQMDRPIKSILPHYNVKNIVNKITRPLKLLKSYIATVTNKECRNTKHVFNKAEKTLYPKTSRLRNLLINANRIKLDTVSKKASNDEKAGIILNHLIN